MKYHLEHIYDIYIIYVAVWALLLGSILTKIGMLLFLRKNIQAAEIFFDMYFYFAYMTVVVIHFLLALGSFHAPSHT